MKRVLITGISGFVGKNLLKYLTNSKEFKVIGHSRSPEKANMPLENIDYIPSLSANTLDRYLIDVVVHLAGIAHDVLGKYSKDDYQQVNFGLTKKIYDCVRKSNVSSFIFVSSIKAVADETDLIVDEEFVVNPRSDYGISKRLAEDYLMQNKSQQLKTYILRPCMIHGPGNKGNLNTLYKFLQRRIPYPLAAFDNNRSYLSVDNFCFVIEQILNDKLTEGQYLLSDTQPISTRELVHLIGEVQDKKIHQLRIPKAIIKAAAKIGTMLNSPLNNKTLGKLVGNLQVSNEKLRSELGRELPFSTIEGLKKTIRSFDE